MNHQVAKMILFDELFSRTSNPFLKSFRHLPSYVLDKILDNFIKSSDIDVSSNEVVCRFSLTSLENDVEKALKNDMLDEVGLLIRYGASKAVISHVTGAQSSTIITKRKLSNATLPRIGRPREFTDDERELIIKLWDTTQGSRTYKLIHIHNHTQYSIDDIWFVIHKKPKPMTVLDVSQQD